MYFVVRTDQHTVEPGKELNGCDTTTGLRAFTDALQRETAPITAVLNLGDVGDTAENPLRSKAIATEAAYSNAKELIAPTGQRELLIPGNHDDPSLMFQILGNEWDRCHDGCFVKTFGDIDIVGVDFRTGPEATGYFQPETRQVLERVLNESLRRCIICCHYPWYNTDNPDFDGHMMVTNGEQFSAVLKRFQEKILAVFHGHAHVWWSGSDQGVPFHVSPGTAFPFKVEPEKGLPAITEGPLGYLLVKVGENGLHIRPRHLKLRNGPVEG